MGLEKIAFILYSLFLSHLTGRETVHYNQQCRMEYQDKLREALVELGFSYHIFRTPSGPNLVNTCYDCRWCGALISGLDTHIKMCVAMPDNLQRAIAKDVERAKKIILDRLEQRRHEMTEDDLGYVQRCGRGPHTDRLELVKLCQEAGICAYRYDLAERELAEAKLIGNFTVSAHPAHDLQIMLPPLPEPAGV